MKNLKNLKVLIVAESSSVMNRKSFKSGLYPEIIKIFHSLFKNTKICFCDRYQVFDYQDVINSKKIIFANHSRKLSLIMKILDYLAIIVGRNLYFEKYRYRNLLNKLEKKYDLIISITSSANSGVLSCLISNQLGAPFIILEHKTHYQRNLIRFSHKRLLRYVQKSASLIAPVSEPLEIALKKFNPSIKTKVVYNPIGEEMFISSPSDLKLKLSKFTNGNYCFGAWTVWRKIKRLDLLLDAFEEMKLGSNQSYKLVIGGTTNDSKLLLRMDNDPDILFLGSLSREDIRSLSDFIDCCVICSDHETFGLPISEAMAQGTPVIATKSGGVEGQINSSVGKVVERNKLNSLAEAMKEVTTINYSNENIKKFAKDKFGSDSIKNIWLNTISSL